MILPNKRFKNVWYISLSIILGTLLLCACECSLLDPLKLTFSFQLNEKEDFVPCYQIAICLKQPGGTLIKTLFLTDFLSYGGFSEPDICPTNITKGMILCGI